MVMPYFLRPFVAFLCEGMLHLPWTRQSDVALTNECVWGRCRLPTHDWSTLVGVFLGLMMMSSVHHIRSTDYGYATKRCSFITNYDSEASGRAVCGRLLNWNTIEPSLTTASLISHIPPPDWKTKHSTCCIQLSIAVLHCWWHIVCQYLKNMGGSLRFQRANASLLNANRDQTLFRKWLIALWCALVGSFASDASCLSIPSYLVLNLIICGSRRGQLLCT